MINDNSSHAPVDWRRRFISLAEDLCRARGQPAVTVVDDPDNHLVLGIDVDGMHFDVLHFPDDEERMVVHCRMAALPDESSLHTLEAALRTNYPLARSHAGMLALDRDTHELIYSTADSLRTASVDGMLESMAAMADTARQWLQARASPVA